MSKTKKNIYVLTLAVLLGVLINSFMQDYSSCSVSLQHSIIVQQYAILTWLIVCAIEAIKDWISSKRGKDVSDLE